jgi:hydrogenase maturation protein HypF
VSGPQTPTAVAENTPRRRQVTVRGVVQGVGFRPYLYGLATELALAGHVTNTPEGVVAEVGNGVAALAHHALLGLVRLADDALRGVLHESGNVE